MKLESKNQSEIFGPLDDEATSTSRLQAIIDTVHAKGGGTIRIRSGLYCLGTIRLLSNIVLDFDPGARIIASTDPKDFPRLPQPRFPSLKDQAGFHALFYAMEAENIGLQGFGSLDGQGQAWPRSTNDMDGRPRLLLFADCRNITVRDLEMRNSALWMQHYLHCEQVTLDGLKVFNHANANNDMIDVDCCRKVSISNCSGDVDDDGITLKSSGPAFCEDVVISNCTISSHCNAIKCGTESNGGFRNISISNCSISPSSQRQCIHGCPGGDGGITLEIVDGGRMENVAVSHILMRGVEVPIHVRLGNRGRPYRDEMEKAPVGSIRGISLTNIRALESGKIGSSIAGITGHRIEDVLLQDIYLETVGGGPEDAAGRIPPEKADHYPEGNIWGNLPAFGLTCWNVSGITLKMITLRSLKSDGRPPLRFINTDHANLDCWSSSNYGKKSPYILLDNVEASQLSYPIFQDIRSFDFISNNSKFITSPAASVHTSP